MYVIVHVLAQRVEATDIFLDNVLKKPLPFHSQQFSIFFHATFIDIEPKTV